MEPTDVPPELILSQSTSRVPVYQILLAIGFTPDARVVSDRPGGLSRRFGRHRIEASICTNLEFRPIVLVSGVVSTSRSIEEVHHELPREMDSMDQGLAWLTWMLDKHELLRALDEVPSWAERGRAHLDLLPWIKRKREYAASPKCLVRRDYARLALKDLAAAMAEVEPHAPLRLEFDGEVLRLRVGDRVIVMPGGGQPWPDVYEIAVESIRRLPRRLANDPVFFGIWEGALSLNSWRYSGVVSIPTSRRTDSS